MQRLKKPTKKSVIRSIKLINSNSKNNANLKALRKLFTQYPKNNKIEEVYLKVVALNEMYSTNIYNPFKVAVSILSLNIDKDLFLNADQVVTKIAKSHSLRTISGNKWNFYSFATKYCSWHYEEQYPIYDSYVAKALIAYKKSHNFSDFKNADLKNYRKFKKIITDFKIKFELEEFSLKEIDHYLWKKGKDMITNKRNQ